MALCTLNGPDATGCRGVRHGETGAIITSFRQRTEDPKEYIRDEDGCRIGFYHGTDLAQTATIQGELISPPNDVFSSFNKSFFGVPLNLNNPYDGYDVTGGDWYFDSIETNEQRGENCTFTAEISRSEGISGISDCANSDGLNNATWSEGEAYYEDTN